MDKFINEIKVIFLSCYIMSEYHITDKELNKIIRFLPSNIKVFWCEHCNLLWSSDDDFIQCSRCGKIHCCDKCSRWCCCYTGSFDRDGIKKGNSILV